MDKEEHSARDFVSRGYGVEPTLNGGFIVRNRNEPYLVGDSAAFSNSTDFLSWISQGHAEFDKERANG